MDTGTVFSCATCYSPRVGIQTWVIGQQGRMYIQHATVVSLHKFGVENSHKAGQYHQVRPVAIDLLSKSMVERLAVIKTVVINYGGLDSGVLGAL